MWIQAIKDLRLLEGKCLSDHLTVSETPFEETDLGSLAASILEASLNRLHDNPGHIMQQLARRTEVWKRAVFEFPLKFSFSLFTQLLNNTIASRWQRLTKTNSWREIRETVRWSQEEAMMAFQNCVALQGTNKHFCLWMYLDNTSQNRAHLKHTEALSVWPQKS